MNRHWNETMVQAEPPALVEYDADATRSVRDEPIAGQLHFRELINLLHRRSRGILAIALCGTMLVFVTGLLMPPKYTAKAQIAIDPPSIGTQAAVPPRGEGVIETHIAILLSRDHLQHVVDNLLDDPEFQTTAPTVHRIETERVADRAPRRATAASWLPGPSDLAHRLQIWIGRSSNSGDGSTLNVDEMERRLKINQEGRSRIIAVSFTSTDPDTATTIANRIAELYIEGQGEQKRAYTSSELARLDGRIAELKNEVERSSAAVQTFMRRGTDAAKQASEAREAGQHLQELEREAVVKGQLYRTLLRRQQEIRDQQETATSDAYILSLAVTPERPSSPNPFLFIFPALIVFLICGSLLAVIQEKLDRGLRSEREINEALGVPCIGLVPQVAEMDGTRRLHQHLLTDPFAAYAEAIRSIAATRQLTSPLHQPKVILITSSLPGEGKTTLAVSLSVCISLLRQRVLLIDLDFKHPSILRELDGKAEQGILDILLKNRVPAEVIQPIPELGLDYLPMNRCSFDPLILFGGEEMPRLLRQLRKNYDCVIIDSPPVLGSTETRLLAAMADDILFVVKWGSTRRELAQNALNLLRRPGGSPAQQLRHVSALIAQVDLKKHARYGYGDAGEYFLNCENHSSGPSGARPAITFRGSYARLLKSRLVSTSNRYRQSASTFLGLKSRSAALDLMLLRRYRLAMFRIRLLQLRISTSLSEAWSHIGSRHSGPAAGVDDPGQSSVEASP
jgi:succinoglycan biosynthesis transport protein ExoP